MREVLSDCYALDGRLEWVKLPSIYFPQDFLFDVMRCMYKERGPPRDCGRIKDATYYKKKLQASKDSEDVEKSKV